MAARPLALALGAVLLAAACTADPGPTEPTTPEPTASGPSSSESGAVIVDARVEGHDVALSVGPLAVDGDLALLPITAAEADLGSLNLAIVLADPYIDLGTGPTAVRLVDPIAGTVSLIAREPDGSAVADGDGWPQDGTVRLVAAFAAPATASVDVLLPYVGYVPGVAVVTRSDALPSVADLTDVATSEIVAPVAVLDTFVEQLGGAVTTRSQTERLTVAVAADVLFATDSADLAVEADEALTRAGQEIARYRAGTLTIVGHTDDRGTDEYNQALSERRAQAVADRLATLTDLSRFELRVEGRGEGDPTASGTSAAARAANRRVELVFVPDAADDVEPVVPDAPVAAALPEPDGPVGTGADGVTVTYREEEYRIALPEVTRVGSLLVGELEVTGLTGSRSLGTLLSGGVYSGRGEFDATLQSAASQVTIVRGDTRIFPVDYLAGGDGGQREPLADRYLNRRVDAGQPQTVTVVWPATADRTVTIDLPLSVNDSGQASGGAPFRLTDVPVVEP